MKFKSQSRIKKDTWKIFSQYIRLRDCLKTTGSLEYGKCVTCGRLVEFHKADAGHFVSRRFSSTLFDERNVHLQCKPCNNFGKGEQLKYRRAIVKMYGEGVDIEIEDKATEIKHWTIPELNELQIIYQEKIDKLKEAK